MVSVALVSVAAATDAAWLAVRDVVAVTDELAVDYRLIGGNAVELLVHVHGVAGLVPSRETADADLAALPEVCADPRLLPALTSLGYRQVAGNRFVRSLGERRLIIDVLMPSYLGRMESNQLAGDLVVDAIPGLLLAMNLAPTTVELHVRTSDGIDIRVGLDLPDVRAALTMKAHAYRGRLGQQDAVDVWRLLEAAYAAGHRVADWPSNANGRDGAILLWRYFGTTGRAMSDRAVRARVRALLVRVVPEPEPAGPTSVR